MQAGHPQVGLELYGSILNNWFSGGFRGMLKRIGLLTSQRKLAGILYADVASYSRLTQEDEEGTHNRLITHLDLMTGLIRTYHGRVAHYAGDAVLAEFGEITTALACAVSAQRDINLRNQDVPTGHRVEFRMGVNMGEIIAERGDIYGNAVNIAARLESLAEPGGICVTDAVRITVGPRAGVEFVALGEQWVKNIAEPIRVYRVDFQIEPAPIATLVVPSSGRAGPQRRSRTRRLGIA